MGWGTRLALDRSQPLSFYVPQEKWGTPVILTVKLARLGLRNSSGWLMSIFSLWWQYLCQFYWRNFSPSEHLIIWVYSKPCFRVLFTEDLIDQVTLSKYSATHKSDIHSPSLADIIMILPARKLPSGRGEMSITLKHFDFRTSPMMFSSLIHMRMKLGLSRYIVHWC